MTDVHNKETRSFNMSQKEEYKTPNGTVKLARIISLITISPLSIITLGFNQ
jgi:hypothetical protein